MQLIRSATTMRISGRGWQWHREGRRRPWRHFGPIWCPGRGCAGPFAAARRRQAGRFREAYPTLPAQAALEGMVLGSQSAAFADCIHRTAGQAGVRAGRRWLRPSARSWRAWLRRWRRRCAPRRTRHAGGRCSGSSAPCRGGHGPEPGCVTGQPGRFQGEAWRASCGSGSRCQRQRLKL